MRKLVYLKLEFKEFYPVKNREDLLIGEFESNGPYCFDCRKSLVITRYNENSKNKFSTNVYRVCSGCGESVKRGPRGFYDKPSGVQHVDIFTSTLRFDELLELLGGLKESHYFDDKENIIISPKMFIDDSDKEYTLTEFVYDLLVWAPIQKINTLLI